MKFVSLFTRGFAASGFALWAAVSSLGCAVDSPDGADAPEEVYEAQQGVAAADPVVALGTSILQHPLYPALSNRVNGELARLALAMHGMNADEVVATLAALDACGAAPAGPSCDSLAASLGTTPQSIATDAAQARKIGVDLGLDAQSPTVVAAAFRWAQGKRDGWGAGSAIIEPITLELGAACDAGCAETLGHVLGAHKADYLAKQSGDGGGSSSSSSTGSGGGSGPSASEVAVWVKIAIDIVVALEDVIYNSDEENKECESDDECAGNEFCHKIGDNDCRPAHGEGHLCDRAAQCLSNCCKPYIGTGLLPSCRPADKCD